MKTHVHARCSRESALDCQYIGTVKESPEVIAEHLRALKLVTAMQVFKYGDRNEVVALKATVTAYSHKKK